MPTQHTKYTTYTRPTYTQNTLRNTHTCTQTNVVRHTYKPHIRAKSAAKVFFFFFCKCLRSTLLKRVVCLWRGNFATTMPARDSLLYCTSCALSLNTFTCTCTLTLIHTCVRILPFHIHVVSQEAPLRWLLVDERVREVRYAERTSVLYPAAVVLSVGLTRQNASALFPVLEEGGELSQA
jgi:hypothetical protein